jgi:hypothetical protein
MATAVATKNEAPLAPEAQTSPANQMLAMIERASKDPAVDVSKLRELFALRKEIADEDARYAFDEAMTEAQKDMRPIAADASNPQTKSRYASYLALDKALRPIYTKYGFALSFNTAEGALDGYVRVVCDVSRQGHTRRFQIDMPADGKGAKGGDVMTKTHATGAAMTYGQRYLLKMIFNIAVGDDNDGNGVDDGPRITQEQQDKIIDALEAKGADRAKFLKWAKVEAIDQIPAAHFESCMTAINNARAKAS